MQTLCEVPMKTHFWSVDVTDAMKMNYPRVSNIICPYSRFDYENISLETMANACERGSKVHAICNSLIQGYFVPNIDAECQPYVDSFIQWMKEKNRKFIYGEKRFYDDELKFSGQVDLVVEEDGEMVLYDLKTSASYSNKWPIQGFAYSHLLKANDISIDRIAIVQLRKTGKKPKIYELEDLEEYEKVFRELLDLYDYFLRKKEKDNERN